MMNEEGQDPEEHPRPRPRVVDKRVSARSGAEKREPVVELKPEPQPVGEQPQPVPEEPPQAASDPTVAQTLTPEQEQQVRAMIDEISRVPARDWVLESAARLIDIAGVKLQQGEGEEARLVIDALKGIIDNVGARFGDAEQPLRQALAQLQLAAAQATG